MIRSILAAFLFSVVFGSSAFAQSCSVPNTLTNGTNADATQVMGNFAAILTCLNNQAAPAPPRSYLAGLTLSTAGSSSTFTINAGVAVDRTNAGLMSLASNYTKTTAGWSVGTGNGSFDGTGLAPSANAGWYHVHLIKRTDTGVVDVLTSNSATAPTLPANYTLFRRIGSMKTNGSFQWISFIQLGDEFLWTTPVQDISTSALGTTAQLFTLSVPLGVQVWARFRGYVTNASPASILINSPDEATAVNNAPLGNISATNPVANIGGIQAEGPTRTNTSAQIRAVAGSANTTLNIVTFGWIDRRGRDL